MNIGRPPAGQGSAKYFINAGQGVPTGDVGNHMQIQHQVVGESIPECLEKLRKQVEQAAELKTEPTGIIRMPNPNGRG